MFSPIQTQARTREQCYLAIARARTRHITAVSEIVDHLLIGVYLGFNELQIEISEKAKARINQTVSADLKEELRQAYAQMLVEVYRSALADMNTSDLIQVATSSELHPSTSTFFFKERSPVNAIKEPATNRLIELGTARINDDAVMGRIFAIAQEERRHSICGRSCSDTCISVWRMVKAIPRAIRTVISAAHRLLRNH